MEWHVMAQDTDAIDLEVGRHLDHTKAVKQQGTDGEQYFQGAFAPACFRARGLAVSTVTCRLPFPGLRPVRPPPVCVRCHHRSGARMSDKPA
jgi:hypothetical protein